MFSYFSTNAGIADPLQATWCDFCNKLLLCQTSFFIKALSVPHLTQGCAFCHPNRACPSVPSHLLSVVLTTAEPIMLRRDGWQLFVDSMPRLISSVCLFWCQHSAGSVGESACLCFKAYPWHQDTQTPQSSWSFSGTSGQFELTISNCTHLKNCLHEFYYLCAQKPLVDEIVMK